MPLKRTSGFSTGYVAPLLAGTSFPAMRFKTAGTIISSVQSVSLRALLVSRQGGSVRDTSLLHLCRSIAGCSISQTFRRGKGKGEVAISPEARPEACKRPSWGPDVPLCRQHEEFSLMSKERMTLFKPGLRAVYLITSLYAMHYT